MKKTLLIALLMMISAMLFAGPFGMEFGWSLEELEASGIYAEEFMPQGTTTSYLVMPENSHPLLMLYTVFIDDEYGLFQIRAISQPLYEEYQIRIFYDDLKAQLTTAYGEPDAEYDEILDDSEWQGSENFISSILYGDRKLSTTWRPALSEGGPAVVALGILPIDESMASLFLFYGSENSEEIIKRYTESNAAIL